MPKMTPGQIEGRRKKLLGEDKRYNWALKDWHVIQIKPSDGFTLKFDIEGNVDEARYAINAKIREIKCQNKKKIPQLCDNCKKGDHENCSLTECDCTE